jgi:hypothetical protein
MSHPAHIYNFLTEFLADYAGENDGSQLYVRRVQRWTAVWNKHIQKHGNVPMIKKCAICSGAEFKDNIKRGRYKVSTRAAQKALKEEFNDV